MVERVESAHSQDSDERRLVDLAKAGDSDAQAELYQKYFPRLYGYFLRQTKNHDSASDLTQDTSIKVFVEHINKFHWREDGALFGSWVFQIAHNQLVKEFRRREIRCKKRPLYL